MPKDIDLEAEEKAARKENRNQTQFPLLLSWVEEFLQLVNYDALFEQAKECLRGIAQWKALAQHTGSQGSNPDTTKVYSAPIH